MLKHTRPICFLFALLALVIIIVDLEAQTSGELFQGNQKDFYIQDYSGLSRISPNATGYFSVTANVMDSSDVIESLETVSFSDGSSIKSGLALLPSILIFENGKQAEQIQLTNIGDATTSYSLELVDTIVDENGKRINADFWSRHENRKNNLFSAKELLKFAPRMVVLKPQEQQKIRVAAIMPENLNNGEYRSELLFRWTAEFGTKKSSVASGTSKTNSALLYLPILIRKGELHATATFSQPQLEISEDSTAVSFNIVREGNRSILGDIKVYALSRNGKENKLLHKTRNVAVFAPTTQTIVNLQIQEKLLSENNPFEALLIEFATHGNERSDVIASATINLLKKAQASIK